MNHTFVPQLKVSSAKLIELLPEHSADVFDFASDEQVAQTALWEAHQSVEDSASYIHRVRKRLSIQEDSVFLCWGVKDEKTSKIIGMISLTQLGSIRAQIGYVFHYQHWNTRLPIESIRAIVSYTYDNFPEIQRLQCRCFPTNHSSIHLLESAGFQYEGINYAMVKAHGNIHDLSCFSMTRKHWSAVKEMNYEEISLSQHS